MHGLILQHIACEPPGVYEDVLRERGWELRRVELDEGEPMGDWREADAIVAMGGPMSVNDEREHPWLVEEKRTIREAVTEGTPFWGACLGVQLLASSLGARVYPGPEPEVGLMTVTLTGAARADPVFDGLPSEPLTLQWHGDTFDLPDGAVLLAGSAAFPHQAFRVGRMAYGVQFHLEVSREMAAAWAKVPAYSAALDRVLGPGALEGLLEQMDGAADGMRSHGRAMFEHWLDLIPQRGYGEPSRGRR